MAFEIEGKLHKKFDTEQKSERFQAREFILLLTDSRYDQYIKFQLTQDRCDLIDPVAEGSDIKVHFDLRGREWNGRYFTNLNAWKIESASDVEPDEQWPEPEDDVFYDQERQGENAEPEDIDDLPF